MACRGLINCLRETPLLRHLDCKCRSRIVENSSQGVVFVTICSRARCKDQVPRKGGGCCLDSLEGGLWRRRRWSDEVKAIKTMKIHRFIASFFYVFLYRAWKDSPWTLTMSHRTCPMHTFMKSWRHSPPFAKPPPHRGCWKDTCSWP